MGLGKTIQAICFLLAVLPERKPPPTFGQLSQRDPAAPPDAPPGVALICTPASVLENWEREMTTWSKMAGRTLRIYRYMGKDRAGSYNLSSSPFPSRSLSLFYSPSSFILPFSSSPCRMGSCCSPSSPSSFASYLHCQ